MDSLSVSQKLDRFFKTYKQFKYQKGQTIIEANSVPAGVYFLAKGYVRQYTFTKSGQELTHHFFKPRSFFPLLWAINNLPNKCFYQSFTPTETYLAPREKVIGFLKSDSALLFNLSSRLLFGLDGLLTRIESLASADARTRTLGILLFLGKHFGTKKDHTLTLAYSFTHSDLANLTGLTRETTSRQVEQLCKQGLITVKNHLISIPDTRHL